MCPFIASSSAADSGGTWPAALKCALAFCQAARTSCGSTVPEPTFSQSVLGTFHE